MAQLQMKYEETVCEQMKNMGKIIYAGDEQYPLEKVYAVSKTEQPFTVQFYTFINAFDGKLFENVVELNRVEDSASPTYELQFSDGSTKVVSRQIKSIEEE